MHKFGLLWKIQTLLNFLDPHSTMLILELQPRVLIALNLPRFLLPCPFLVHFCLNSALPTCLLFANHLNSSLSFFFYPIKNLSSIMEITRFKQKVAQEALSDWKKNLFWRRLAILAKIISNFLSKTAKKSIWSMSMLWPKLCN